MTTSPSGPDTPQPNQPSDLARLEHKKLMQRLLDHYQAYLAGKPYSEDDLYQAVIDFAAQKLRYLDTDPGYGKVQSYKTADDWAQEVAIKVANNLHTVRENFSGWLNQIVDNTASDAQKLIIKVRAERQPLETMAKDEHGDTYEVVNREVYPSDYFGAPDLGYYLHSASGSSWNLRQASVREVSAKMDADRTDADLEICPGWPTCHGDCIPSTADRHRYAAPPLKRVHVPDFLRPAFPAEQKHPCYTAPGGQPHPVPAQIQIDWQTFSALVLRCGEDEDGVTQRRTRKQIADQLGISHGTLRERESQLRRKIVSESLKRMEQNLAAVCTETKRGEPIPHRKWIPPTDCPAKAKKQVKKTALALGRRRKTPVKNDAGQKAVA